MSWNDDSSQRDLARRVVRHVLVGGRVSGIAFKEAFGLGDVGPFLEALVDYWNDERRAQGPAALSLEGRWMLSNRVPQDLPSAEAEVAALSIQEQMEALWSLREDEIVAAEMPDVAPHLIVRFASGRVVFVWGGLCDHLEPWELVHDETRFQLIWMGSATSIWVPDNFGDDEAATLP